MQKQWCRQTRANCQLTIQSFCTRTVIDSSPLAKKPTAVSSLIFDKQRHVGKYGTRSPCLLVYREEKLAPVWVMCDFSHQWLITEQLTVQWETSPDPVTATQPSTRVSDAANLILPFTSSLSLSRSPPSLSHTHSPEHLVPQLGEESPRHSDTAHWSRDQTSTCCLAWRTTHAHTHVFICIISHVCFVVNSLPLLWKRPWRVYSSSSLFFYSSSLSASSGSHFLSVFLHLYFCSCITFLLLKYKQNYCSYSSFQEVFIIHRYLI